MDIFLKRINCMKIDLHAFTKSLSGHAVEVEPGLYRPIPARVRVAVGGSPVTYESLNAIDGVDTEAMVNPIWRDRIISRDDCGLIRIGYILKRWCPQA